MKFGFLLWMLIQSLLQERCFNRHFFKQIQTQDPFFVPSDAIFFSNLGPCHIAPLAVPVFMTSQCLGLKTPKVERPLSVVQAEGLNSIPTMTQTGRTVVGF